MFESAGATTVNLQLSDAPVEPSTLVELLRLRASQQPDRLAFSFLGDDDDAPIAWTYSELDRRARAIGAWLTSQGGAGERVVLLFPPGLDAIAAFFGCLYAGAVAVPSVTPRPRRPSQRLDAILADSGARFCLTTESVRAGLNAALATDADRTWLTADRLPEGLENNWIDPAISPSSLAFLQYTSGSTSMPRGVMVSHGNVMHNLTLIRHGFQISSEPRGVFWLPMYHDMGLIGGVLQPIFVGGPTVLMAPASFLQRPIRWLRAISDHGATISGAPNFAFDLCVDRISPEERATLDLSRWELAFCGAEPIRWETLQRFTEAFAPAGFRGDAFYPCYGLAEATLMVTGGVGPARPRGQRVVADALRVGRVVTAEDENASTSEPSRVLVSCGQALLDQTLRVVNPETRVPCPPDRVGEIWVSGTSIAQGYWRRPEESAHTFGAQLAESDGRVYMRTGDLGFLADGELVVTGRLKDLIIVNGRNHYPHDIEQTVAHAHPALRAASGAAFTIESDGQDRLVVVHELDRQFRNADTEEIINAARRAVAEDHDLPVSAFVLVKPMSVPKTSSGKIQRHACRDHYLEGTLETVAEWRLPAPAVAEAGPNTSAAASSHTVAQVEAWLIAKIAGQVGIDATQVDSREPFAQYGLNSVQAVSLAADLETFVGHALPPTLIYDYPTIESLARHLGVAGDPSAVAEESTAAEAAEDSTRHEPIAVIGLGCRFPGADGADAFWRLLDEGVDAVSRVPADRWDERRFFHPEPATPGKMNTAWGGFLQNVDQFDPSFFGIAPREAVRMDPQQRLLLEVSWEALEHAGIVPQNLGGSRTGVFVGISNSDYSRLQGNDPASIDAYVGTGNAFSIAANRLSHIYDFRGPSLAVDTACSSSLVSLHLAARSLRSGECDLALAGGVNLILRPEVTITFSQARMMASDGRCKTFDAAADGYVRGEGCGLVVLKRLSDAVRDGDRVLAVIRGTAVNHDGRSNGLTAPNGPAQQAVIRQALDDAGVSADQIGYIEAHGTGTALGDPIEFDSLRAVVGAPRADGSVCYVGAVKTNLGHLEAAAGIASFIKVVLALVHEEIPAHLHLHKVSPHIDLTATPIQIPTQPHPWRSGVQRRFAGVSSFGFGGTNAHVVVEEAPAVSNSGPTPSEGSHLLTLSAKTERSLSLLAERMGSRLLDDASLALDDVCFTANTGRSVFAHRLAIMADRREQLAERLIAAAQGETPEGVRRGHVTSNVASPVVFLFTGQGKLDPGTARRLFDAQPVFQETMIRCDRILRPLLEQPLLDVLYPAPGVETPLNQTRYAPAALFAVEYSLATFWRSLGVEPAAVMGHSLGEYVAACVAGAFSLEEGLELVVERARLMHALPSDGAMAAALASPDQVLAAIGDQADRVAAAAFNGPENVTLSGDRASLAIVLDRLRTQGVATQWLEVSHAYHSPLMDPVLDEFERWGSRRPFAPLAIPLVSNLTGELMPVGAVLDAHHWRRHLREPVRFGAGIATLGALGHSLFLEIGPNLTLSALARLTLGRDRGVWLASLQRGRDDEQVMNASLAQLYTRGVGIDWPAFHDRRPGRRVSLPTYAFDRQRYWVENPVEAGPASSSFAERPRNGGSRHPLLGSRLRSPLKETVYEATLNPEQFGFLNDHIENDRIIVPASVWLEMATAAAAERWPNTAVAIDDMTLAAPLAIPVGRSATVQLIVAPRDGEEVAFEIHSLDDAADAGSSWILRAAGRARSLASSAAVEADPREQAAETGVELPPSLAHESDLFLIHPALLDSALEALGHGHRHGSSPSPTPADHGAIVPVGLDRFEVFGRGGARLWGTGHVAQTGTNGDTTRLSDLVLRDATGQVRARLVGFREQSAAHEPASPAPTHDVNEWLYEMVWTPRPQASHMAAASHLTPPSRLLETVEPRLFELAGNFNASAYDAFMPRFETICGLQIQQAFRNLDATFTPGDRLNAEDLATHLGVVERHHRLFGRLLEILAEDGVLDRTEGGWTVVRPLVDGSAEPNWPELVEEFPAARAEIAFARRGGEHLAEVLRGECDPLHLLFPNGSFDLADQLYRESPGAQVFNGVFLEGLLAAIATAPADRPLRILEIGAGTGGTTSFLLPRLPRDRTEYTFTDLSRVFLLKAQEQFEAYPFVRYEILDIERDPASQGFEPQSYDVILAANVLHATADLRQTLSHVQRLLAPEGMLVLLEGSRPRRWLDLSFGLTEGWWRFQDPALRSGYPLLSGQGWVELLQGCGFSDACAIPSAEVGASILGDQAVVVARGAAAPGKPEGTKADETLAPWLIWADRAGVGEAVAAELRERGETSVLVTAGERFLRLDEQHVQIDVDRPGDVEQLLETLLWGDRPACRGVIHLWNLDAPAEDPEGVCFLETAERLGCGSLLPLLQALARKEWADTPRVWVATQGAQAVTSDGDLTAVAQSPVWGLGRALAHEHPELWGGLIDLDPKAGDLSATARQIVAEVVAPDVEDQVAYRDGERFAPRFQRTQVSEPSLPALVLRSDASYLITGGLGGIGLRVASWMVERGARHLILLGRTPMPSRAEWDSSNLTDVQAERVAAIRSLEAHGATVNLAAFDVADESALRDYLATTRSAGRPPVRGVIHAAADVQGGTLPTLDAETLRRVLRPKVAGTWVLHRALDEAPLDFFVMFSTIPTHLGWLGQGASNYVAANAFLNALAHHRRAEGLPASSLIWGAWAEVGLAARTRGGLERLALQGVESMSPEEGLLALETLLAAECSEVAVARIDWSQFFRAWPAATASPLLVSLAQELAETPAKPAEVSANGSTIRDQIRQARPEDRAGIFASYLKGMAARVLGLGASPLDIDQPLVNLGLDSLMAIELKNRIEVDLGVRVPMVEFLKGPSIAQLTTLVLSQVVDHASSIAPSSTAADSGPHAEAETEWEVMTL